MEYHTKMLSRQNQMQENYHQYKWWSLNLIMALALFSLSFYTSASVMCSTSTSTFFFCSFRFQCVSFRLNTSWDARTNAMVFQLLLNSLSISKLISFSFKIRYFRHFSFIASILWWYADIFHNIVFVFLEYIDVIRNRKWSFISFYESQRKKTIEIERFSPQDKIYHRDGLERWCIWKFPYQFLSHCYRFQFDLNIFMPWDGFFSFFSVSFALRTENA